MKFKQYKKGIITSEFSDNSGYRPHVHTGVDWSIGYNRPITADNAGQIAHIDLNGTDGWRAVWQLVPYQDHLMEICYGHLEEVYVQVGDWVDEEQEVGTEGNRGLVFHNGVQITSTMREAGDTRGHHVHEQWRPVKLVDRKTRGKHYRPYKHNGKYVEVVLTNSTRGCIDPTDFLYTEEEAFQDQMLDSLKNQFEVVKTNPTESNKSILRKLWITLLKIWK